MHKDAKRYSCQKSTSNKENHISEKSNIIFAQQGTFYLETDSDKTT